MNNLDKVKKAIQSKLSTQKLAGHNNVTNISYDELMLWQDILKNMESSSRVIESYSFLDVQLVIQRYCEQDVPESELKDFLNNSL